MQWCCAQFQGWHSEAGRRGLAVFATRSTEGQVFFVLQFRATEPDVRVTSDPVSPVSLVSQVGVTFCPWCGVRLLHWYRKNLEPLERPDLNVSLTRQ
jgi:hypothetical protein